MNALRWRIPRLWPWVLAALILLFAAYTLAGFYLVTGLVRSQATSWVKTNLDKPIALGEIKFNPLTFTLDIDAIALPDAQSPMGAVGHLRVGFSILSLFQSALSLYGGNAGPALHPRRHAARWIARPGRA